MPVRISERDLVVPTLRFANESGSGRISTSELIERLEVHFQPSGEDAAILDGRHDTKFSQKVRNLVSHRSGQRSMFGLGYADYLEDRNEIQITEKGVAFLATLPDE